jgi:hypothetical protein
VRSRKTGNVVDDRSLTIVIDIDIVACTLTIELRYYVRYENGDEDEDDTTRYVTTQHNTTRSFRSFFGDGSPHLTAPAIAPNHGGEG